MKLSQLSILELSYMASQLDMQAWNLKRQDAGFFETILIKAYICTLKYRRKCIQDIINKKYETKQGSPNRD